PSVRTPTRKAVGEKFRAIVEPNPLRLAPPGGDLLQDPNDPFGGQRRVHFDRDDFADPFIQNVACPEPPPAVQRIAHEVHRPDHIRLRDHVKWLDHPGRDPLLGPARRDSAEADNRRARGAYGSTDNPYSAGDPRISRTPSGVS